jgi:NitT/TauT family transport system substrate-binding protein
VPAHSPSSVRCSPYAAATKNPPGLPYLRRRRSRPQQEHHPVRQWYHPRPRPQHQQPSPPSAELANSRCAWLSQLKKLVTLSPSKRSFFTDVGLDVELVTTQGTPGEVIPLVAVGQLDLFSGATQAALVNARPQGVEVTIVAGEEALRRGTVFHAYAVTKQLYDQGVRSVSNLRGRTLAMPSDAGIDHLELKKVLESGSLTLDDVKLQLIRPPDMPTALQNGAVEAAELIEPYATIATKQLDAAVPIVAGDALVDIVGDNFPISVIVVGPPMLKDPALLEAFLVGYLRGARYYLQALKDPVVRAEVAAILKNRTPLKDDKLYEQMTWPGVSADGTFDIAKLEEAQQLWKQRGKIQQTVPVDQLVDFRFVTNAAKQI